MNQTPLGEDVVYQCRKSGIGLAAIIGDSIIFTAIITAACVDLYEIFGHDFFIALAIVNIFPVWYGVYGFLSWKAEIHTVSTYSSKEGGSYRKVTGPFSIKINETSITRATPDLKAEIPFLLRVWEYFTGQSIMKITLRSDGQSIISSELMPTRLYKAISDLKGEPPKRRARDNTRLADVAMVIRGALQDHIIPKRKAVALMDRLLQDEILD